MESASRSARAFLVSSVYVSTPGALRCCGKACCIPAALPVVKNKHLLFVDVQFQPGRALFVSCLCVCSIIPFFRHPRRAVCAMEDSTRVLLARLGGYECHPRTEVVHEFYGRKTPVMV